MNIRDQKMKYKDTINRDTNTNDDKEMWNIIKTEIYISKSEVWNET